MGKNGAGMRTAIFGDEHKAFREMVRGFIAREVAPVYDEWMEQGQPPRDFYRRLGEVGILGIQAPEEFGGGGEQSFKYNAVVIEETAAAGVSFANFSVHSNLILPYLTTYATEEQKR